MSLQLIQILQKAGKSFEFQVGPDKGHTAVSTERMIEFLFRIWCWTSKIFTGCLKVTR